MNWPILSTLFYRGLVVSNAFSHHGYKGSVRIRQGASQHHILGLGTSEVLKHMWSQATLVKTLYLDQHYVLLYNVIGTQGERGLSPILVAMFYFFL